MEKEKGDWLRELLRQLGVEHEADAAKQKAIDLMARASDSKRETQQQIADLTKRIEKLEQGK